MHTITIAYYLGRKSENAGTTLFDRLICLATGSRYSHLEYVRYYYADTGKGRCWSSSPRDGGVRPAIISLDSGRWEVYQVQCDRSDQEIEAWFELNKGKKYDWLGAVATKIKFLPQIASRLFCSEAIGVSTGVPFPSDKNPQDIFNYFASTAVRVDVGEANSPNAPALFDSIFPS